MENGQKYTAVWSAFLDIIRENLTIEQYSTWFKPIMPLSLVDSTLTISVPTDYYRQYIEEAFIDLVSKTLKRVIGPDAKLIYRAGITGRDSITVPANEAPVASNRPVPVRSFQPSGNPNPMVYPGLQRVRINPNLKSEYRFSTLVTGACNKLGISIGQNISEKPGQTPFNPLFIYGGSGLGKTHLAQAIGNAINEKYPELIVLYVTGNEFKTQYMEAVNVHNKLTDFLAFYNRIDVLIVDDIHELAGQGSHNAFFNIFNHLHMNGKQLILTSDRSPKDLDNFEDRLLSRFKWGLSVELMKPDYNTRLEMLRSLCRQSGVTDIEDDCLQYIALNVKDSFRELHGAFISLMAYATYDRQGFTKELVEQIVSNIVGEDKSDMTIDRIKQSVCEYFNVSESEITSNSRKRQIVQARQIAMYLCRNMISNCSLSLIGSEIGGKDHSTVLHSCSIVSDLMSTDRTFKKYVVDLQNILQPAE